MYITNGTIITDAGIQLWNDALANSKSITFTTIKLGTGDVNSEEEARALLDLVSFYSDIGISNREETSEGYLKLRSYYTNDNLTESVTIKETGVYAQIDDGAVILFAYINDGEGETIPPQNGLNTIQRTRDIVIGITQQIPLNVIIDDSMFATIYDIEEKADKVIQMIAGNGLSGGGDLSADRTIDIASATDGIIVNADNIQLNTQNVLTSTSTTQPLSANMGKQLNENISAKEDIGVCYPKTESDARYEPIDSCYTKPESDAKFLTPVGGILVMADNTSPADKYPGTTWAIQADGRYMMGGNQSTVNEALGSNSITVAHGNLPAVNLIATDHTHTRGSMEITGDFKIHAAANGVTGVSGMTGANYGSAQGGSFAGYQYGDIYTGYGIGFQASRAWSGATSGASALTVPLGGSGTALGVTPAYTKFVYWKRTA